MMFKYFFGDFCSKTFGRKRGRFPLLIASAVAPSGCGVRRARFQRDVREVTRERVGVASEIASGLPILGNGTELSEQHPKTRNGTEPITACFAVG